MAKDIEVLQSDGVPYEVLDPAGCIAAEPGLAPVREKIAGGLRLPNDETGDCFKFTNELARLAEGLGVEFRFGVKLEGLRQRRQAHRRRPHLARRGRSRHLRRRARQLSRPNCVKPLGLKVPVYPVKGYSITVPIIDETRAPVSTIMDDTYKIAITRLGDRIRVGGMAEIAGFSTALPRSAQGNAAVLRGRPVRRRRRPEPGELLERPAPDDAGRHAGDRPRTRFDNLYLNTGHGTLGWTMACGSGRVLADMIGGTRPEIDVADLALSRYA